jgi:hypothetical protein
MNQPINTFDIQDTPEFQRILALPRRDWEERIRANDLYRRMTAAFKLPRGQMDLFPIQAAALADAHDKRGLIAPIGVGGGKTLTSFLLPTVIPGVVRPVLLVPAALVAKEYNKTWHEFRELQKHWLCHPEFSTKARFDECIITYQALGREGGKDALMARRPDMIIADEAHLISNRNAACTKRFERYMLANPNTIFCAMSGTITKRSIRDYWHLFYFALREGMPLPRIEAEMEKWAEVLDERKVDGPSRRGPGVLIQLCGEEDKKVFERTAPIGRTQQMPTAFFSEQTAAVRRGYQKRMQETPGVVSSRETAISCSLVVRRLDVHPGATASEQLRTLREKKLTPNGDIVRTPMDVWRHARELACGFYYRWEPRPPSEWLEARSAWNWYVREILFPEGSLHATYAHLHLDSPRMIASAIVGHDDGADVDEQGFDSDFEEEGKGGAAAIVRPSVFHPNIVEAYHNWAKIRGIYKINTVAQWMDETVLRYCSDWISKNGPAIVWTEHRAFGEKLAALLNTGFCAQKGLDGSKKSIEQYDGKTVVASVGANCTGRNLQAWNKNLIVTCPPTGRLIEQLIGRTHRTGQKADTVYVDWICACDEQDQGFSQMRADARYIQDTFGTPQKLCYADHL